MNNYDFDDISFWWMNDNHTFIKLHTYDLDEIILRSNILRKRYPFGCLCRPVLKKEGSEVRRIGIMIIDGGSNRLNQWESDLIKWKIEILKHKDVLEFLQKKIEWKQKKPCLNLWNWIKKMKSLLFGTK